MSESELADAKAKAKKHGVTVANMVRIAIKNCEVVGEWTLQSRERHEAQVLLNQGLSREVAKVGNNLNQIARWCNTHQTAEQSLDVLTQLQKIECHLEELTKFRTT